MPKGRPRQFDTDQALHAAMEVFWRKGYEQSSCGELLAAMQIRCGSMYSVFGDKEQLCQQVLQRYHQQVLQPTLEALADPVQPLHQVRQFVTSWRQLGADPYRKGCLLCRVLSELETPTAIRTTAQAMLGELQTQLTATLTAAQTANQWQPKLQCHTPAALAATLLALGQGLTVLVRAGATVETQEGIIQHALALLE